MFTASNSYFMPSEVHRNGRKIRSAAGTSLAVLLGFVLFGLLTGRLYADDEESCRACIKSFWHDVCYFRITAFDYMTDDFVDFSPKGSQTNRTELRQSFSDHRLFFKSVNDRDFSAAHAYLKNILSRHIVKNGKKDSRKYADLSPEEQKTARTQMQVMADGMSKLCMQRDNSMQIRKLSASGEEAIAEIMYSDKYFHNVAKLTLKKHQDKWKISKMEHLRSTFIQKAAPQTGNSRRTKSKDSRSQTDLQIDSDLLNAARSGNYEAAAQAIAKGADVNAKAAAIPKSDFEKYGQKNLKLKASVNKSSKHEGATALHYAAGSNAKLTELLLQKGADVNNNLDPLGATPLHRAASGNQLECVKILVLHGADIYAKNDFQETPLINAIEADALDVVKYFIEVKKMPLPTQQELRRAYAVSKGMGKKGEVFEYFKDPGKNRTASAELFCFPADESPLTDK